MRESARMEDHALVRVALVEIGTGYRVQEERARSRPRLTVTPEARRALEKAGGSLKIEQAKGTRREPRAASVPLRHYERGAARKTAGRSDLNRRSCEPSVLRDAINWEMGVMMGSRCSTSSGMRAKVRHRCDCVLDAQKREATVVWPRAESDRGKWLRSTGSAEAIEAVITVVDAEGT